MMTIHFKNGKHHATVTEIWLKANSTSVFQFTDDFDNHVYEVKVKDIAKIVNS